jgi:putative ABC transport system substrate-binding protein
MAIPRQDRIKCRLAAILPAGMDRRGFIAVLGGASVAWPLKVHAEKNGKTPKVGVLWHAGNAEEEAIFLGALRQGLSALGYVEDRNISLLNTFAAENYERFNENAAELVRLRVDLIVAASSPAAMAAKRATTTIPIVFVGVPDPIGSKLVDSLARPGGNVTGLTHIAFDTAAKRMALFKEAVPNLSRVALLVNASDPEIARRSTEEIASATLQLDLTLVSVEVRAPGDFDRAFSPIARNRYDGMYILSDPMLYNERARIAAWALAQRLPTVTPFSEFTAAGAFMSYGPNFPAIFRRAGAYIDKLLKGARPADLPVEVPTKFDLVLNLRTAKVIGIELPPNLLARADEVIE